MPRGAWDVKLGASSADIRLHTRVDTRDQTGQRGTQRPFDVRIVVNAAGDLGRLPDVWRFFGADEPNYATMPHGQKLLGELGDSLVVTFPLPRAGVSLFEWRPKAR